MEARGQGVRGGWFNPVLSVSASCVVHAAPKRFPCTGIATS